MKRGEIILLWIAGLWTLIVSVVLILAALMGEQASGSHLIWLVLLSLPVWIVCGLIWVTVRGRSPDVLTPSTDRLQSMSRQAAALPLHKIKELAQSDEKRGYGSLYAVPLRAACTSEEIEKFATDTATAQEIRATVSRLLRGVKNAEFNERCDTRVLLDYFYLDLKLAEEKGAKDIVSFVFDAHDVRTYFMNVIDTIVEDTTFFRDGVKMLRPSRICAELRNRLWNNHQWERELLEKVIGQKAVHKLLQHFGQLSSETFWLGIRWNQEDNYLPVAKAMRAVSVSDFCNGSIGTGWLDLIKKPVVYIFGFPALVFLFLAISLPFVLGFLWFLNLGRVPSGQWFTLPSLKQVLSAFPYLVDADWKLDTVKFFLQIGIVFSSFGIVSEGWPRLREWYFASCQPHECRYCYLHYRKESDAENCCLNVQPWWRWRFRHRVISQNELVSYVLILFLVGIGFIMFLEWNPLLTIGLIIWVIYCCWKVVRLQATCMKCGVRADYYSEPGDVLCSRCYAKTRPLIN